MDTSTSSTEDLLQEIFKNDNLSTVSAAINNLMKQKEREQLIRERFGDPKPYLKKKNGETIKYLRVTYKDDFGNYKTITAKTPDELEKKLWKLIDAGSKYLTFQ